jgi:hypothetical protein
MSECIIIIAVAVIVAGIGWMVYLEYSRIKCYYCGRGFRANQIKTHGITEDACCYVCGDCMKFLSRKARTCYRNGCDSLDKFAICGPHTEVRCVNISGIPVISKTDLGEK